MAAIADLGGLGVREGNPTLYNWTAPNILPALVPWIGILLLLLLPANRTASAWLVWLPLVLIVGVTWGLLTVVLSFIPSEVLDWFRQVISAQAFGIASVWLLGNHLGRRHRFVSFLGTLGILAAFSAITLFVQQDLSSEGTEVMQMAILLGLSVLAVCIAFSMTGFSCRGRYRPIALTLWFAGWLSVAWLLIAIPFACVAVVASGADWQIAGAMLLGGLTAAAICFGSLLPFLLLSFASPFFRERLKDLLNLGQAAPPIITSMPDVSPMGSPS